MFFRFVRDHVSARRSFSRRLAPLVWVQRALLALHLLMDVWLVSTFWLLQPITYPVLSPRSQALFQEFLSTVPRSPSLQRFELGTILVPFTQTGKETGARICLSVALSAFRLGEAVNPFQATALYGESETLGSPLSLGCGNSND